MWAKGLAGAGHRVPGIDVSEAMVGVSRGRVPEARFRVASLFEADIPPCKAVTVIGEGLNHLFDPANEDDRALIRLFGRVYDALTPGGVFVFDVAEPGQVTRATPTRTFAEGEDRVVPVEKEDQERETPTRRIVTFRRAVEC